MVSVYVPIGICQTAHNGIHRVCREGRQSLSIGKVSPWPAASSRCRPYTAERWCTGGRPGGASSPGHEDGKPATFRRYRVPVPILAGTGCPRTADQGAGRLLTPRKTSACFAAARTDQASWFFAAASSRDRGGPAGGAGGVGVTIRTGGTGGIEEVAGAATTAAWPMVPTWFSRVGFHRGPT
jgi:hypothetical protein